MKAIKHWTKIVAMCIVGAIIVAAWCVTHPRSVFEQAKKEWK
jgi:hypothetical protein